MHVFNRINIFHTHNLTQTFFTSFAYPSPRVVVGIYGLGMVGLDIVEFT